MSDGANTRILDRAAAEEFGKTIQEPLDSLRDFIDYGTALVLRCWGSSGRTLKDIVALLSLFKNALAMVDAAEVMLRRGVMLPTQLQIRSLFEVSVTLQWLLKEKGDDRAYAYHVANLRRQATWIKRSLPRTREYRAYQYFWSKVGARPLSPEREKALRAELTQIKKVLRRRRHRAFNQKYEPFYKMNGYDMEWYRVLGTRSFRAIAKDCDRLAEYSVIYSTGSEVMHGSSYRGQVAFDGKQIVFDALRSPEDASNILTTVLSLASGLIHSTLKYYRPAELPNLAQKYVEDWKYPLRRIPRITVNSTIVTLDR